LTNVRALEDDNHCVRTPASALEEIYMLNRREFLGTGLGAYAVAALGEDSSKMLFSYSGTALFGAGADPLGDKFIKTDRQMEDALKLCASFGYQGVEPFRGQGPLPDDPPKLKALLEEAGLRLCTVSGGGDLISPDKAQAAIESNFRYTRDVLKPMGCQHLKINIGGPQELNRPPEGTPLDQLKAAARNTNELGKRIHEELGMKMGFHPHIWSPIENERETMAILDMTDPRYVGIVPDTAHFALGKMDPVKFLRDHYSRIVAIHLKDTDAKYRNWKGPTPTMDEHRKRNLYQPMGSGGVDFVAFFQVLREHNYSYWVNMDYDAARKEEGTLEQQLAVNTRYLRDKLKVDLKTV
jgi:inosose dehydratase